MHTATTDGYRDLVNGEVEYSNIKSWLESEVLTDKFLYVKKHQLLNDVVHGSLEESLEIIFNKIGSNPDTVYGHNDFSIGNIFATSPLTVFDPIPFLTHPYMDLGRTLVLAARTGLSEPGEQILKGYFGDEKYDRDLLKATVLVNAYMKLRYWYETKRLEDVKNLQAYLVQNKG